MTDPVGGVILAGSPTVLVGGPTATVTITNGVMTLTWGGMVVRGSPADVERFTKMITEDAMKTDAGQRAIASIVTDPNSTVTVEVGRGQAHVLGD